MAKRFEVTLAKAATYTDMSTGKVWRKNQRSVMGEAEAARYQSNPRFLVKEMDLEAAVKAKAKVAAKADAPALADQPVADDKKKTAAPAKKKS